MPDPCHSCGASIFAGAFECAVCKAPVKQLTAEERAARNRGPKLAAAITIMAIGGLIVLAGLIMILVTSSIDQMSLGTIAFGAVTMGTGFATLHEW